MNRVQTHAVLLLCEKCTDRVTLTFQPQNHVKFEHIGIIRF